MHEGSISHVIEDRKGYSVAEVARQHGLSVPFVRLEIKRGRLLVARLGRRIVVPQGSVRAWLEAGMAEGRGGVQDE